MINYPLNVEENQNLEQSPVYPLRSYKELKRKLSAAEVFGIDLKDLLFTEDLNHEKSNSRRHTTNNHAQLPLTLDFKSDVQHS
ncbi:MAG: hypothetical protein PVJ60_09260 [Phycisphaerales bacterium]